MRRTDREVSGPNEIFHIIQRCDVCRLAFFDEEYPYIIPLNFGVSFDAQLPTFYFHGAGMGTKMALMKRNPKVGFELDCGHSLVTGPKACDYSMEYESVCGTGTLSMVPDYEKEYCLTQLMNQYVEGQAHTFDAKWVSATTIWKLTVRSISGKRMKRA